MSSKRYRYGFKTEVVRQITDRGNRVKEVADRLRITTHSLYLYAWLKHKFNATRPLMPASASHCQPVPVTPTRSWPAVFPRCHRLRGRSPLPR